MAIKAIIIDDEVMARNLLKGMVETFCENVEIIDACHDLPSGVLSIRKNKPDVVFLDIEMPGYNGLEILNFFSEDEVDFSIIFTTSYNEYAVNAFKLSAIDYLLKPIEPEDLIGAVEKLKKVKPNFNMSTLRENLAIEPRVKKIPIHTLTSIVYVDINDIMFLKAEGAYTKIFLKDDSMMMASKVLKHFEDMLVNEKSFLRTHKSYMANINYVTELVKSNGGFLKIKDFEVKISTDKVNEFVELMKF